MDPLFSITPKSERPSRLDVDAQITPAGIDILVNGDRFPIIYPEEIWAVFDSRLKEVLRCNLAYSSTMFLPQMLNLDKINYTTDRPVAEPYYFENGMFDMASSAISDKASSLDYIKRFYNTRYNFAGNYVKLVEQNWSAFTAENSAVIPLSFGKESLLSFALCRELGVKPILINVVEPSNKFEYFHKKPLMEEFEKEFGVKVYTVFFYPGYFRYGKFWNLNTELGWGLHTTEYATLLAAPFAAYFRSKYVVLGNEQSCNDIFLDTEGVLTYKAGYDQYRGWTPQQSVLASLVLGRQIGVISLVEPLYEIAEMKILHHRYPEAGKYQMSCFADNDHASNNRWCQNCVKCGYMYALGRAFNFDMNKIGFKDNLFGANHAAIYDHFFGYNPQAPAYGSQEELGLGFYLSYLAGAKGESIDRFKRELLPRFEDNFSRYKNQYLGVNETSNIPEEIKENILRIYREELDQFIDD